MKNLLTKNLWRVTLALFFVLMLPFAAQAQKEILLYSTDFSNWNPVASDDAKDANVNCGGVGGTGFVINQGSKPSLTPTGNTLCFDNNGILTFPSFNFVDGGAVEITLTVGSKASKTIALSGANVLSGSIDQAPAGSAATISSTGFISVKNAPGTYKITFVFSGKGAQTLALSTAGKCTEISLNSIKLYSGVGTTPYVVCTNYPQAPASGLSLSSTAAGAAVTGSLNIKAYNITNDVTLSFSGDGAVRFSSTSKTIPMASALAGTSVPITFTPSVKSGIANALATFTSTGVTSPYPVSLAGLTGAGTAPQIVADTATINFWTYLIAKTTNTINVAGLNLTGDISLSLEGTNASQFSLSSTTIANANAALGASIGITYTGNIEASTQTATLVISSPGATAIKVPLLANTYGTKPVMYALNFIVSPAGSGFVEWSPANTKFMAGTKIKIRATPETGNKLDHWSDGKSSNYTTRAITASDLTQGTLIVYFTPGTTPITPPVTGSLVAYDATSITTTGFTASWTAVSGATGYTVTVYNADGSVKTTIPITSGTTTTVAVPGLFAGTLYSYSVETTGLTTQQNSGKVGPYKTLGSSSTFVCGHH